MKGPDYEGPSAAVVLSHITGTGSRKECAYSDLEKQFGEINRAKLFAALRELEERGQVKEFRRVTELFYSVK